MLAMIVEMRLQFWTRVYEWSLNLGKRISKEISKMHFLRGKNVFVKCIFTGTNGNKSTSSLWYCRIKFVHNTNKYWLPNWLMQFFFFLLRKWISCWYFCEVFFYIFCQYLPRLWNFTLWNDCSYQINGTKWIIISNLLCWQTF